VVSNGGSEPFTGANVTGDPVDVGLPSTVVGLLSGDIVEPGLGPAALSLFEKKDGPIE
jgi:hypothetical protein